MRPSQHLFLLASCVCAAIGQSMFKLGADGRSSLITFINPPLIAGLVLYSVGAVLWIYTLSKASLSAVYPYTALTFVLVYASAILLFGEAVSWRGLVGAALVLGGLFVMAGAQ